MIANTIAARTDLDMSRQIFFIDYGGWDHHDEVLQSMNLMLTEVDDAMGELYHDIECLDDVHRFEPMDCKKVIKARMGEMAFFKDMTVYTSVTRKERPSFEDRSSRRSGLSPAGARGRS